MLDTVRVNPLLISATDSWEIQPDRYIILKFICSSKTAIIKRILILFFNHRWKNVEPHDVIISCAKLLMNGNPPTEPNISMHEPKSSFSFKDILGEWNGGTNELLSKWQFLIIFLIFFFWKMHEFSNCGWSGHWSNRIVYEIWIPSIERRDSESNICGI